MSLRKTLEKKSIVREEAKAEQEHERVLEDMQNIDEKVSEMRLLMQSLEESHEQAQESIRKVKDEQHKLETAFQEIESLFEEYKSDLAEEGISSPEELLEAEQYSGEEEIVTVKNLEESHREKRAEARDRARERGQAKDKTLQTISEGGSEDAVEEETDRQEVEGDETDKETSEEDKRGKRTYKKIVTDTEERIKDLEEEKEKLHSKTPEGREEKEKEVLESAKHEIQQSEQYIDQGRAFDVLIPVVNRAGIETVEDAVVDNYIEEKERRIEKEKSDKPNVIKGIQERLERVLEPLRELVRANLEYVLSQGKLRETGISYQEVYKAGESLDFIARFKSAVAEAREGLKDYLQTQVSVYPGNIVIDGYYGSKEISGGIFDEIRQLQEELSTLREQINKNHGKKNVFGKRTKKMQKELTDLQNKIDSKEQDLSNKGNERMKQGNHVEEKLRPIEDIFWKNIDTYIPEFRNTYVDREMTIGELLDGLEEGLQEREKEATEAASEYAAYQELEKDMNTKRTHLQDRQTAWEGKIAEENLHWLKNRY